MEKVKEMPSWHDTAFPATHIGNIIFSKELHSHDSKDKDDNTENKDEVGERGYCLRHDYQDIIEGLPGFSQFEDPQEAE